jgi:hypothetical protein
MPYKQKQRSQTASQYPGFVDVDKTYDLYMNKYKWGNADREDVYFDEKNRIMFMIYRVNASRLAGEFIDRGDNAKAIAVLDKVMRNITEKSYFYDVTSYYMAIEYYTAGAKDKGKDLASKLARNAEAELNYILSLSDEKRESQKPDMEQAFSIINSLSMAAQSAGDVATAEAFKKKIQMYSVRFGGA